jgi:hypothetical protein
MLKALALFICVIGLSQGVVLCTHAIGWWLLHVETAYPTIDPVPVTNASTPLATAAEVYAVLRRAYSGNGLDHLAAALLLIKLNTEYSAPAWPPTETALADDILTACPPNDPVVWAAVVTAGQCAGTSLVEINELTAMLLALSNGKSTWVLCAGVGGPNPQ